MWRGPPETCELAAGDLHLWLADLLASDDEIEQAQKLLSPDEVERARRFRFQRDARRYVVAHAALRAILGRYLSIPPRQLTFQTNAYGKPSLALGNSPGAPLTFNLSHAGELALVGIARGRQIGVDIEQIRPEFAQGEIARRFFSPGEVRSLAALPAHEQTRAFFRCWTRKEAFVKARGEGLSLPLDSFDVTLLPGDPPAILQVAGAPAEAENWSVHSVPVDSHGDYEAAAVVEGGVASLCTWQYTKHS